MRLKDSRVLITGASSGIGAATARAMAGADAHLTLTGRDRSRLDEVAAATGGRVLVADLATDAAALASLAAPVDILVASAGLGWAGPFSRMPHDEIERLVTVNLTAPMLLTRCLLPGMLERGRGHIVLVASIAGALGVPDEAVYSATKAGLLIFAEGLRQELPRSDARESGQKVPDRTGILPEPARTSARPEPGGLGARQGPGRVGVSVILPGVVRTEFFGRRGTPYTRRHPSPMPPERVANAIVHAIEHDLPEMYVPGWLQLPARLRAATPNLFRRLAGRFG
jgi:short-subunit dehydrogenase